MMAERIGEALGRALLHSLPQGAVLCAAAALSCACTSSPRLRNALRGMALAALAAAFLLTFASALGTAAEHRTSSSLAPGGESPERPSPLPYLALGWAAGASLALARLLLGWRRLRGLRAVPGRPLPAEAQRAFLDLARRLGVRASARVVDAVQLAAPIVVGALRPLILVPAQALSGLSPAELEALLAHELAHVRRLDYALNLLQALAEALFFYHPAVWLLGRGLRSDRELCCDDVAVRLTRDPLTFARALARVEALRGEELLFGMSAKGGPLMKRIRRLLDPRRAEPRRGGALLAFLSTATLTGLGLGAVAAAQETPGMSCSCCCCCRRAGAGEPIPAPAEQERADAQAGEAQPKALEELVLKGRLELAPVQIDLRGALRALESLPVVRVPGGVQLPGLRNFVQRVELPSLRVEFPDLRAVELPALDLECELPVVEWPRVDYVWHTNLPRWIQPAWPVPEVEGAPDAALPDAAGKGASDDLDEQVRELRRTLDALRREAEELRKELREAKGDLGP